MKRAAAMAAALLLASCAGTPFPGAGWDRTDLAVGGRLLASAAPATGVRGEVLTIVIEGDGAAHDARGRPSRDPTPRQAVGLQIARAWPQAPNAWLGRLCQYVRSADRACQPEDWSRQRFAEPAIAAADAAVDQLKARAGAQAVQLVGWSGGGVIATALAARRTDVVGLVTLAAPLDLAAWSAANGTTPLPGPVELTAQHRRALPLAQLHLFGARDEVTPALVALEAAQVLAGPQGVAEVWIEDHICCWAEDAPQIAQRLEALRARSGPVAPPPGWPAPGSSH